MGFFDQYGWRRTLLTFTAALAVSAGAAAQQTGTFTDGRDGQKYKTAVIGGKKWMAENLNVKTGTSWCYGNQESNCKKYGRLYAWSTAAKMACPNGWHLPTREEWGALAKAAGGTGVYSSDGIAGVKLKSKDDWGNGGGADSYGFSALPGGQRDGDGDFGEAGATGYWWTVTANANGNAYNRAIYRNHNNVFEYETDNKRGFSVRCVEGEATVNVNEAKPKTDKPKPAESGGSARAADGSLLDSRDGQTYKTVKIGDKTWTAQNANYNADGSRCYDDDNSNCKKYGRLYDWNTAKTACPTGFHLPSREEWVSLAKTVGGRDTCIYQKCMVTGGKELKSKSGWSNNGNGSDAYGFAALPGGAGRQGEGGDSDKSEYGYWWTASEEDDAFAVYSRIGYANGLVPVEGDYKGEGFSARCVKDD